MFTKTEQLSRQYNIFGSNQGAKTPTKEELTKQLNELKRLIDTNNNQFDVLSDEDLTEALIFEYKALLARYRYVLKQVRQFAN